MIQESQNHSVLIYLIYLEVALYVDIHHFI